MSYRDELMNELNQYVAGRIQEIRITKGMTQEDVAKHLGITRQAYGKYESELTPINLPLLSSIATILDSSLSSFLPPECTYKDSIQPSLAVADNITSPYTQDLHTSSQTNYNLLIHLFAQLSSKEQSYILSYMKYKAKNEREETSKHP